MELDWLPPTVMPSPAMTLSLWPNECAQAQLHTWPNFGQLGSNIFVDIVFTRFFGSLPAVTLTFDLWSQKLISTSTNPDTSVIKIGWNSLDWFVRYGVHKVYGSMLWPWLLTLIPKANQPIYESKHISGQNWVKFPSLLCEIWCSQCFRDAQTHTFTHSQTDRPEYRHKNTKLKRGLGPFTVKPSGREMTQT